MFLVYISWELCKLWTRAVLLLYICECMWQWNSPVGEQMVQISWEQLLRSTFFYHWDVSLLLMHPFEVTKDMKCLFGGKLFWFSVRQIITEWLMLSTKHYCSLMIHNLLRCRYLSGVVESAAIFSLFGIPTFKCDLSFAKTQLMWMDLLQAFTAGVVW